MRNDSLSRVRGVVIAGDGAAIDGSEHAPDGIVQIARLQQRGQSLGVGQTIILTEVLRMVVPARRPEATEESTPLPRPIDPDAEAGRGRLGMAY